MTTNNGSKTNRGNKEFTYYIPDRWVSYFTQEVAVGITSVVSAAITVFVIILVLLGGLWLAYVYLPSDVFFIILAVLIADIALGIVLRAIFSRR